MAGIYFHIPFCKQACHYCDFHFSTQLGDKTGMIESLKKELAMQRDYLKGEAIETIYFGGGTPSMLSADELRSMLQEVNAIFSVAPDSEVTLEANPDDLTREKLDAFREIGLNRLSIGIQSFQNDILKFLNRAHDSSHAIRSVTESRSAGFQNISIDLIFAIPGQPEEAWIKNIHQATALNPEHISAYNLTIEPRTAFGNWSKKGKLTAVSEDVAARQLELLINILGDAGYQQYEVSNFSKPGFESRHNSSYWQRKPYLGIGPSAHSYNKESRQYNVSNNQLYIKGLASNTLPFEKEILTRDDQVNEYLLTALRTRWGADLGILLRDYNYDLLRDQKEYIDRLITKDLATVRNDILQLTAKGKMMADKISSDFFLIP